jgi:hypothetical protein
MYQSLCNNLPRKSKKRDAGVNRLSAGTRKWTREWTRTRLVHLGSGALGESRELQVVTHTFQISSTFHLRLDTLRLQLPRTSDRRFQNAGKDATRAKIGSVASRSHASARVKMSLCIAPDAGVIVLSRVRKRVIRSRGPATGPTLTWMLDRFYY